MEARRKKSKRANKKVKSLSVKGLTSKQIKSVKGGYEGTTIATYSFQNAWPRK